MPQERIRPFSRTGYEILDEHLATLGEVTIWSVDPLIPRLDDRFTIENGGCIHEIAVYSLTTFKGGWSAACRLLESY